MRKTRRTETRRPLDPYREQDARIRIARREIDRIVAAKEAVIAEGETPPAHWLVAQRGGLRNLRKVRASDLSAMLNRQGAFGVLSADAETLAAWLLMQRVSPRALFGLQSCANDPNPGVRKHVARALRRAEAWSLLRRMAGRWPDDEWVQRFAIERAKAPHAERLSQFMDRHVEPAPAEDAPPMPLWARDRYWFLSPPKRGDYLRRVLLRIQRWVRGQRTP